MEVDPGKKLPSDLIASISSVAAWPTTSGGALHLCRSTNTKAGPVIGDIINHLSTLNGQVPWAEYDQMADSPILLNAVKHAKLDPLSTKAATWANKYMVLQPYPPAKSTNLATVLQP